MSSKNVLTSTGMLSQAILNENGIVTWSYLEDLALKKPEDSPEFQVLLQQKGIEEIDMRRQFLGAQPQFKCN